MRLYIPPALAVIYILGSALVVNATDMGKSIREGVSEIYCKVSNF